MTGPCLQYHGEKAPHLDTVCTVNLVLKPSLYTVVFCTYFGTYFVEGGILTSGNGITMNSHQSGDFHKIFKHLFYNGAISKAVDLNLFLVSRFKLL